MKRFLLVLLVTMLALGGLSVPAFSDTEGVVTVTAEQAQVSVSVFPDSVSYGIVSMGEEDLKPIDNPTIRAGNTGNWWADFQVRGADTTDWTLDTTPAEDTYVHYVGWGPPGSETYTELSTSNDDLGPFASYAPGSNQFFKLMMDTPTSSTSYATQETQVTVVVSMATEGITVILDADGPYTQGGGPATLTANVTDQDGTPVTGITLSNFMSFTWASDPPVGPPLEVGTATWSEVGGGVYIGSLPINTLTAGTYTAAAQTHDGTHLARGFDAFVIEPSP